MPKKATELSAIAVRRLTTPGRFPVGGVAGLMLQVTDSGARSWILRYSTGETRTSTSGKPFAARRDIGLGGFPDVSLNQAREKARKIKESISRGTDPISERAAAHAARLAALAKNTTFETATRQFHEDKSCEFRNIKHAKQWISSMERYAFPTLGRLSVADIEMAHVEAALRPIWRSKTETASRVRQRIEAVLAWATVKGLREGDNPAAWKGRLDQVLPRPSKIKSTSHFRALPWRDLPAFMSELRKREGIAARALEFTILTACRSGESRLATWDEIDLSAAIWTIPAGRIKAGKQHKVPISDTLQELLCNLPRHTQSDIVFAAPRGGALSDMALTAVLKRMGSGVTVHGFRSTFKDWARNNTTYADEVSELALAHVNSDATRAAYARDELLPQRSQLMMEWSNYCLGEAS